MALFSRRVLVRVERERTRALSEKVTPFGEMGLSREVLKRRFSSYRIHFKRHSQKEGFMGQKTINARPVISFLGTCE